MARRRIRGGPPWRTTRGVRSCRLSELWRLPRLCQHPFSRHQVPRFGHWF